MSQSAKIKSKRNKASGKKVAWTIKKLARRSAPRYAAGCGGCK